MVSRSEDFCLAGTRHLPSNPNPSEFLVLPQVIPQAVSPDEQLVIDALNLLCHGEQPLRQRIIEELAQKQAAREFQGTVSVLLNGFDLMERFLTVCRGRGCQLSTISSYRSMLRPFTKKYPDLPFDPEVIGGYLSGQKKDSTRKEVWKVLNTFYAFVSQAEKVPDPMPGVPKPKVTWEEKEWLTLDEAARLISACETDRERALVDCYLNEGLRLSEALDLDIGDIGQDVVMVTEKGKKNKRPSPFPLLPEVRESLLKLCDGLKPGPVFRNYKGNRLGRDTAERAVRGLFDRAGIHKERETPHTLRHSFSSLAAQAGCNQYMVKRLLRHATSGGDITDTYTHITFDHLRKALETYSPVRLIKREGGFSSSKWCRSPG